MLIVSNQKHDSVGFDSTTQAENTNPIAKSDFIIKLLVQNLKTLKIYH
jgi:hypothetical protein